VYASPEAYLFWVKEKGKKKIREGIKKRSERESGGGDIL
jgi:hypothetical protein